MGSRHTTSTATNTATTTWASGHDGWACHPAVVKAVEQKLHEGTTFGMPHQQEWELAEENLQKTLSGGYGAVRSSDGSHPHCLRSHEPRRDAKNF